jgi:hypothetical protein
MIATPITIETTKSDVAANSLAPSRVTGRLGCVLANDMLNVGGVPLPALSPFCFCCVMPRINL